MVDCQRRPRAPSQHDRRGRAASPPRPDRRARDAPVPRYGEPANRLSSQSAGRRWRQHAGMGPARAPRRCGRDSHIGGAEAVLTRPMHMPPFREGSRSRCPRRWRCPGRATTAHPLVIAAFARGGHPPKIVAGISSGPTGRAGRGHRLRDGAACMGDGDDGNPRLEPRSSPKPTA